MSAPDLDRLLDHSQWLRPMARALVHDEHLAEDVLQETYLAAVRRPPTEAPLGAWLAHVLRNVVRMQARKEGRRSAREERVARPEQGDGPSQNDLLELRLDLVHALLDVREPYRSTLILRFYDELSPQQIAEAEGVPASTVRVRLKRGLDTLRERFDRRRDAGLLALLLLADLPGLDAAVLWEELEDTERTGALPGPRPAATAWVVTPLLIAIVFLLIGMFGTEGDAAANRGGAVAKDRREDRRSERASESGNQTGRAAAKGDAESGLSAQPDLSRIPRPHDRVTTPARSLPVVDPVIVEVVDRAGHPVAGATIWGGERRLDRTQISTGFRSTQEFLLRDRTPQLLGITDRAGECVVERRWIASNPLSVRAPGHRTHGEGPTLRALPGDRHRVTLDPPISTTVIVTGEGRRTIESCQLSLVDRTGPLRAVTRPNDAPWAIALEEHTRLVRAEATGFASVQDFLTAPFHPIELPLGSPLFGRLVDARGAPITGAEVRMRSGLWRGVPARTTSDEAGHFTTIPVPRSMEGTLGTIDLVIEHPDFARGSFTIEPEGTTLADLALAPGATLTGQVLRGGGEPRAAARLTLAPVSLAPLEFVEGVTAGDGSFRLDRVAAGEYWLRAEAAGAGFVVEKIVVTAANPAPLELRLPATERLAGTVRDAEGIAVAGVPVRIGAIFGDALAGEVAVSDAEGRFFVQVPAGSFRHHSRRTTLRFAALPEDARDRETRTVLLEVFLPHQLLSANGEEIDRFAHFGSRNCVAIDLDDPRLHEDPLELVIETPEARVPLRFELVDEGGEPIVAFTNLLVASPEGWTMKDFAGLDGRPLHLPDPWVLDDAVVTVMARGFPWRTVRLDLRNSSGVVRFPLSDPFRDPPRLKIDPAEELELLVAPLIEARDPLLAIPIGKTDAEGALTLETLGPGRYRVSTPITPADLWRKNGKRRTSMPLAETREIGVIDITLHDGQKITLRQRSARGERNEP